MPAHHTLSNAINTAVLPAPGEHLLHIFPSFGIGGVPLRMVRVINHFGKQFRHTVIALDNRFDAAIGVAADLDVRLLPRQSRGHGLLAEVTQCVLELRRLRPDLLLTYNWGAIEWA